MITAEFPTKGNYIATMRAYERLSDMGARLVSVSSTSLPVHGPERKA